MPDAVSAAVGPRHRSQRPEVVSPPDHVFQGAHERRGMPPTALGGRHRHGFDVSRAQRPSGVDQSPLDHCTVGYQPLAIEGEGVQPAERVLPVLVPEAALEGLHKERPGGRAGRPVQCGCVHEVNHAGQPVVCWSART